MIDWRSWAKATLDGAPSVTSLIQATSIYGAGSLTGIPEDKPFILIRFGPSRRPGLPAAFIREMQVWAHDEPGDYMLIEQVLEAVREVLVGPVVIPNSISCTWNGHSTDLADDGYGTIAMYSSYDLMGFNPEEA